MWDFFLANEWFSYIFAIPGFDVERLIFTVINLEIPEYVAISICMNECDVQLKAKFIHKIDRMITFLV